MFAYVCEDVCVCAWAGFCSNGAPRVTLPTGDLLSSQMIPSGRGEKFSPLRLRLDAERIREGGGSIDFSPAHLGSPVDVVNTHQD